MKSATKLVALNAYQQAIISHLIHDFGYSQETALEILKTYKPIMRLIGSYPTALDYAGYFHHAWSNKRTCEEWIQRIQARKLLDTSSRKRKVQ